MRTVFPNAEIPHLWAHQTQTEARNANKSFWFDGATIYSYREPIGRIETVKGKQVALLRDKTFSVTTSGHQGDAARAVCHLPSFHVAELHTNSYDRRTPHTENVKAYRCKIKETAIKATRAHKNRDWYTTTLAGFVDEANRYSKTFGLRVKFSAPDSDEVNAILNGRKNAAKREAVKQAKRAEELRQRLALNLDAWKARKPPVEDAPSLYTLPEAYARIDGDELETTKGARVPLEHVKRALPIVLRLLKRGEEYVRNGHTIHIGNYSLDRITTEGTVIAGCHTFLKDEILRIASLIPA